MIRTIPLACALALATAGASFADDHVDAAQLESIMAFMAEIGCEMDPDDIEVEDDGSYDLDDVQCPDGQYDITLDAEFNETGRRKE